MTHLDLFSGIGGFAYAADQVWDDVTHIFCDNDKFCQQVLKKHWPESEIYGDIRQIDSDTLNTGLERGGDKTTRHSGQPNSEQRYEAPFLLTGGFPCQPFSAAGLRRGTADERHLWPEMLRVIRLTQPAWVIAENVGGILTWNDGLVFEQVCADLEAEGYEVQPFVIPAVAVNAPHRRDRVWFVAHAKNSDDRGDAGELSQANELETKERPQERIAESGSTNKLAASDTRSQHGKTRGSQRPQPKPTERASQATTNQRHSWTRNWPEVAAEFCSVDDGLPVELDGLKLSKSQHRKEQLKAYGNAIVPQVAMQIMEAIALS